MLSTNVRLSNDTNRRVYLRPEISENTDSEYLVVQIETQNKNTPETETTENVHSWNKTHLKQETKTDIQYKHS